MRNRMKMRMNNWECRMRMTSGIREWIPQNTEWEAEWKWEWIFQNSEWEAEWEWEGEWEWILGNAEWEAECFCIKIPRFSPETTTPTSTVSKTMRKCPFFFQKKLCSFEYSMAIAKTTEMWSRHWANPTCKSSAGCLKNYFPIVKNAVPPIGIPNRWNHQKQLACRP